MGKIPKGINGPIEGKVGDVVGSSRNGVPYIKSAYKKQTKPSEGAEAANQSKFTMAHQWLKPLIKFVRDGFLIYKRTSGAYNAAKSNLLLNAFEDGPDGAFINPKKVTVSYGDLPLPANLSMEQVEAHLLKISWDPSYMEDTHPNDQVMLLAYDVDNRYAFGTTSGQFRSTGSDILEIIAEAGCTYHVYAAFNSVDRTSQSMSIYMGTVSI